MKIFEKSTYISNCMNGNNYSIQMDCFMMNERRQPMNLTDMTIEEMRVIMRGNTHDDCCGLSV